jgi:TRAP-type transport system small permease protein
VSAPERGKYSPEGIVATLLLVAVVATVFLQVIGRAGLSRPPIWTEELSRWLFVWMIFLGLPEVERTGAHLQVELIPGILPPTLRMILFTIIDLVMLAVISDLVWVGLKTVGRTMRAISVTMPTSDAVLYAAFPVAGICVILRVVQKIVLRWRHPAVQN